MSTTTDLLGCEVVIAGTDDPIRKEWKSAVDCDGWVPPRPEDVPPPEELAGKIGVIRAVSFSYKPPVQRGPNEEGGHMLMFAVEVDGELHRMYPRGFRLVG